MFLCVDRASSEELLQEHGLWKGSSELASARFHLICKTLYCCNALHVLSREQILLRESSFKSRIKANLSLRDKRDLVRQADTEQEKCWKHSPVLCCFSAQKKKNSLKQFATSHSNRVKKGYKKQKATLGIHVFEISLSCYRALHLSPPNENSKM